MLSNIFLATTVIGLAAAQVPAIARRDFLENRQTDGLDPECASAVSDISSLYSSVPTPPADLLSVTLPSDPCVTPTFTGKLQSEWATYTSEALQWYTSHSDELLSFVTACSGLVNGAIATGIPVCSSEVTGVSSPAATTTTTTPATHSSSSGASGSTPGPTSASSSAGPAAGSGSPSSTVPTPNAAPRETSFVVAAAVAAAGFMGAVAAL
ncbi:hypothetical protein F5X97DRAFT_12460 [Nemania serpens]|nr:hypothetical protein F5X97DRAFT_12460 [Nemania serpens]